jgi:hypothetical protein
VNAFRSFDGIRIAYHDEGEGPPVILLHGGYVDGLGQFGEFDRILPILEVPKVAGGRKCLRAVSPRKEMAPQVGLEPTTLRLTAS